MVLVGRMDVDNIKQQKMPNRLSENEAEVGIKSSGPL